MNIVEFNTVPYGSTGRIAKSIAKRVSEEGNMVLFVCGWTKSKKNTMQKEEIIATSFFSKASHLVFAKLTGLDGFFSAIDTALLIYKLKKIKPDIMHFHIMHDYFVNLPMLFRYANKYRIKMVWTFHDCWAFTGGCPYFTISGCDKWKRGCYDCGERKKYSKLPFNMTKAVWKMKFGFVNNMDNLVTTTPSVWLAGLVKHSIFNKYPNKVIHNGIDIQKFKPVSSDFKSRYHCEDKYMVLGVAFDWGERKGLDIFIELAHMLPEVYVIVLVGTNEEIDKRLPDNIISIHKTNNQDELIDVYSAADVFVNPTREEVFGMVNIEALACGTPVITFDTDGSPECIDDTCGIVVKNKTATNMKKEIIRVCQERIFGADACIKRARKFDENKCYAEYLELYKSLMQN